MHITPYQIANIYSELALLLELSGENAFKIRAYENAKDTLFAFSGTTDELSEALSNKTLKGFGPDLSKQTQEIISTGTMPILEQLRKIFPKEILALLDISGLGPKKLISLRDALNIHNLEHLKLACLANKVAGLKGFGKKTQEKFIAAIAEKEAIRGHLRLNEALSLEKDIRTYVMLSEDEFFSTGQLRRHMEVVNKMTFLALVDTKKKIIEKLRTWDYLKELKELTNTVNATLLNDTEIEIFFSDKNHLEENLLKLTGPDSHLTELSKITGFTEKIATEKSFYNSINLVFIPPEYRDNPDAITLAHQSFANSLSTLPLVTTSDLKGILHLHTTYSDGHHSLREMAIQAQSLGYEYIGVTDHSQSARYAGGLFPEDIKRQHKEIDILNNELSPFKIFKGIESDILVDGSLDYPENILKTFDFIIASVHSRFSLDKEAMTERIIKALSNPYTTILGHPTGRLLLERPGYEIDIDAILEAAAKNNVSIELNANPKRLDLDWRVLPQATKLEIKIEIGPDAHSRDGLSDTVYGVIMARKAGLLTKNVLNSMDKSAMESFLKSRRK